MSCLNCPPYAVPTHTKYKLTTIASVLLGEFPATAYAFFFMCAIRQCAGIMGVNVAQSQNIPAKKRKKTKGISLESLGSRGQKKQKSGGSALSRGRRQPSYLYEVTAAAASVTVTFVVTIITPGLY